MTLDSVRNLDFDGYHKLYTEALTGESESVRAFVAYSAWRQIVVIPFMAMEDKIKAHDQIMEKINIAVIHNG